MKTLCYALLVVWTLFDVKPQENQVIEATILATERNVICGHEPSFCSQLISLSAGLMQAD